jgi:hypothetical protein
MIFGMSQIIRFCMKFRLSDLDYLLRLFNLGLTQLTEGQGLDEPDKHGWHPG